MKAKTYKCKWCGKGGFKTPLDLARHTNWCPKARKKRTQVKTSKPPKGIPSNIVYVPMALALNFSNNTFDIVSSSELQQHLK